MGGWKCDDITGVYGNPFPKLILKGFSVTLFFFKNADCYGKAFP